ncbi:site-2 protease family protein [Aquimarina latercula]|uniref:site-2 protease family protein n=1 Tax=Aquimarina latercula TaxID=987 RepID=UPI0003FAA35B|nr:site-2 protease family protein [Aquimarina latercula]
MKGSLFLGRVFNVAIKVHWTFLLIIAWVSFLELKRGGNVQNVLMSIFFVLLVFICVVLHEFGHILTARKFGVSTKKITLLPIGGIASMDTIPENPKEELLISLAGPAVNIVIALLLVLFIPFELLVGQDSSYMDSNLSHVTIENLVFYLFSTNVILALFNFIPAFPMDGGRIFRALLALRMDRVKATSIATGLGEIIAFVFLLIGALYNPFLILIALFIYFGATSENKMVRQLALIKGHSVKEAMLTKITVLKPDNTIGDVIDILLKSTEKNFIVVEDSKIIGILHHQDILSKSKNKDLRIKDIMDISFASIDAAEELKEVFVLMNTKKKDFFAVTSNNELVGAIDLPNISEFILIQSNLITR